MNSFCSSSVHEHGNDLSVPSALPYYTYIKQLLRKRILSDTILYICIYVYSLCFPHPVPLCVGLQAVPSVYWLWMVFLSSSISTICKYRQTVCSLDHSVLRIVILTALNQLIYLFYIYKTEIILIFIRSCTACWTLLYSMWSTEHDSST